MNKIRITSPVGIAKYPHLVTPDTRFDVDGLYQVTLLLGHPGDTKAAWALADATQTSGVSGFISAIEEAEQAADATRSCVRPVQDDVGNDTGMVEIRFKMRALIRPKIGDPYQMRPQIFDSKVKPVAAAIGGGSKIKVCFDLVEYASPNGKGCSPRLVGVQVIELVEYKSGCAAGFASEEGYTEESDAESAVFPSEYV